MLKSDFKIYVGITGNKTIDWQSKLEEINQLGIKKAAVFIEWFDKKERPHLYKFLLKSSIKEVPLVHLRHDSDKEDMKFFIKNYKTQYFNIHEEHFDILDQWAGYEDKLYLEMNYDDDISKDTKVRNIGDFCIDLSHLKSAIARGSEEATYALLKKGKINFACNHLNGYDPILKRDKHTITNLKDFDYLTTLPKFIFGNIIAIETSNSIKEQLEFKKYLDKLLKDYLAECFKRPSVFLEGRFLLVGGRPDLFYLKFYFSVIL